MRETVWELKRRGWIDVGDDTFFKDLQHLRNIAAHEHDRIHEKVAPSGSMLILFTHFEEYMQKTFKRLANLLDMKWAGGKGMEKAG